MDGDLMADPQMGSTYHEALRFMTNWSPHSRIYNIQYTIYKVVVPRPQCLLLVNDHFVQGHTERIDDLHYFGFI